MTVRLEVTFSGTAGEWEARQRQETCLAAPSPGSSARCEMPRGHDAGRLYEHPDPVAAALLSGFHCGRTRGGYWKTWPVS